MHSTNRITTCMLLILAPAIGTASAQDLKPLARLNLDLGGDNLVTVLYSNGHSADIKAGQLLTVSAGAVYQPTEARYTFEGTIGYKVDRADTRNGSAEFTRIPIDFIASFLAGSNRIGAGITYHLNPKLKCSITGVCSGKVDFSDALGALVQYAYDIRLASGATFEFGARYTSIDYTPSAGATVNGNAAGIFAGFAF